jgi:uncharacterized protein (DUF736 family)
VNKQADINGLHQIQNVLINSPIKLIPNTQVMHLRKPEAHIRLNSVDVQNQGKGFNQNEGQRFLLQN